MKKLFYSLLDLIAPKANAEITTELSVFKLPYPQTIEFLISENRLIEQKGKITRLRIDGNFFSDFKAIQVVIGKEANPSHYSKVGFDLEIELLNNNQVEMRATERVILGHFEISAFEQALNQRLNLLISTLVS